MQISSNSEDENDEDGHIATCDTDMALSSHLDLNEQNHSDSDSD